MVAHGDAVRDAVEQPGRHRVLDQAECGVGVVPLGLDAPVVDAVAQLGDERDVA